MPNTEFYIKTIGDHMSDKYYYLVEVVKLQIFVYKTTFVANGISNVAPRMVLQKPQQSVSRRLVNSLVLEVVELV